MSADTIVLWLVTVAAPAQTLFVIIYGLWSPWWKSQTGRAIFTKALGLALLLDVSLWIHRFGPIPDWISISVVALVAVGSWLQLTALAAEKVRTRHTAQGYDSTE